MNFNLSKMNLSSIYTFRDENDYLFFFIGNSKGVTHSARIYEIEMIYTKQTWKGMKNHNYDYILNRIVILYLKEDIFVHKKLP